MTIAEIIAVGSEMLTPFRQDTNSLYLTSGLNDLGVSVAFKTIVGDSLDHLTGAIAAAVRRADIVICSGGLGPTEDDLTREAVAAALGIALRPDPQTLAALYKRFAERRMSMPPNNAKQADALDGAAILENRNGSAPGQMLEARVQGRRKIVVLLPGPPKELKALFEEQVRPRLAARLPPAFIARRQLRMALLPESAVDAQTAPIYREYRDVETTILAGSAEIQLNFVTSQPTLAQAQARVDELAARIEDEMEEDIFSSHGETLEEVVLLMLGLRQLTLASAESCTGGLFAQRLTAVPNSSRSFLGGVVAYSPAMKTLLTGTPKSLIDSEGTVSEAVAKSLAQGIRIRTGADFAVGITGLAGPGGGGPGPDGLKPVGTVYIALADANAVGVKQVKITGDRERIRWWASQHALEMLRRRLLQE